MVRHVRASALFSSEQLAHLFSLLDFSLHSDNPRGASRLGFSELSAVQSTVILHFSFAVKQDQELGTELLKHMKSGKLAFLSPFSLMCLLTMARVHRFEDSVMDYLKLSILSIFKDEERTRKETWVTRKSRPSCMENSQPRRHNREY